MELDTAICRDCSLPIERIDTIGASWYHANPDDSDRCPGLGNVTPEPGTAKCGTCLMTAHPGADCPMVAGQ